jgi:hypothetical protein
MSDSIPGLDSIQDSISRDIDVQMRRDREAVRGVLACLSITNMKVVPSMSEETVAFTCTVKFGKVAIAHAKNDGCGGNTFVCPKTGKFEMLKRVKDQWATCLGGDQTNMGMRFDLEAWLDDAAAAKLKAIEDKREEASIRRWISSRVKRGSVVFRVGDEWRSWTPNLGALDAPRSKSKLETSIKASHPGSGNFFFPSWWTD